MSYRTATAVRARAHLLYAIAIMVLLFGAPHAVKAQSTSGAAAIGEITYAEGVTSAQRPGQAVRLVTKGDPISEGDVITTNSRGYTVLALKDGTRVTLRPNTSFSVEQFSQRAGDENLAMRLLRGGLRAVTGLISKRPGNRTSLGTPVATIGIRGTEFDARICGPECQVEARGVRPPFAIPPTEPVVARVVLMRGEATAVASGGASRTLVQGAALLNGETVRTAPNAYVVLAFRDQSKVTVVADSELRIDDVRYDIKRPEQNSFAIRLLKGGLRALSGLVGKRDPSLVRIGTPVATIGIRGTGVDARTTDQSDFAYTWDGAVGLQGNNNEVVVERDRAAAMTRGAAAPELLPAVPQFFLDETAPRPDQVDVDFDQLFEVKRLTEFPPGLYVGVRSGNVGLGGLDLGPWEAALLAEGTDKPVRIEPPQFLFGDRTPLPDDEGFRSQRMIELYGPGMGSEECIIQ